MMTRRRAARHIGTHYGGLTTSRSRWSEASTTERSYGALGPFRAGSGAWKARSGRPDQAAVCLELFWAEVRLVVERRDPEELRRRPRWRVEVSKGRCVEAGLSWRAHQSVLL
jgi:hypothetical protein